MLLNDCTHLFQPYRWGCCNSCYYLWYVSVWLPLLHPQRVYLQSTEGNWKADGISLVSQAEVRVSVWLRGLPLSGRGRCEAHHLPCPPARLPACLSLSSLLSNLMHAQSKQTRFSEALSNSQLPHSTGLSPTAPRSLSHTETTLHSFRVFIFPNSGSCLMNLPGPMRQHEFNTHKSLVLWALIPSFTKKKKKTHTKYACICVPGQ